MGSAKSGKSDYQYIQALSSERTAEKIKGKSKHIVIEVKMYPGFII